MRVQWTQQARADLLEIGRYIARDNPSAARAWVEKLRQRAREAALQPLSGRMVPEYDRVDLCEVPLLHFRIVYRVVGTGIIVITVFAGSCGLGRGDFEGNA